MSDLNLAFAKANVGDHMDAILRNFREGAKITVTVRFPDKPTQDFMMSSDDPAEVIKLIERRMADAGKGKQ